MKQRLALAVRRLRVRNTAEQTVTTVVLGSRNINGSNQEDGENDKGKDPLQSNDLDGELAECQRWKNLISTLDPHPRQPRGCHNRDQETYTA